MYLYCITNLINNKKYIGVTVDYKKRWANECGVSNDQVITKAILKYGKQNFKFEVLLDNILPDDIDSIEQQYIQLYNSLTPNGYNIEKGGMYNKECIPKYGYENSNAHLTEQEAQYIKNNRNIPALVLYEQFYQKISYGAFKKIYKDITYKNIKPTVDMYPYNFEFACQFSGGKLTYSDIQDIRNKYNQGIYWKDAYQDYKEIITNEWSFWNIYYGNKYKLVMPEVFTKENRKKHASIKRSGENNGRARTNWEEVRYMRQLKQEGKTNKEIQEQFPQYPRSLINCILRNETWKE